MFPLFREQQTEAPVRAPRATLLDTPLQRTSMQTRRGTKLTSDQVTIASVISSQVIAVREIPVQPTLRTWMAQVQMMPTLMISVQITSLHMTSVQVPLV